MRDMSKGSEKDVYFLLVNFLSLSSALATNRIYNSEDMWVPA